MPPHNANDHNGHSGRDGWPEGAPVIDLDAIGQEIGDPDLKAANETSTRLTRATEHSELTDGPQVHQARGTSGAAAISGGYGRLGDLAAWWSSVRAVQVRPRAEGEAASRSETGTADAAEMSIGWVLDAATEPQFQLPAQTDPTQALQWGVDTADRLVDDGTHLIVVTVAADHPARLVAAELLGLDAVEACGWPMDTGTQDEAWMSELLAVRDGLRRTKGLRADLPALLGAAGSSALAAATALILRATARRTPILLDGFGAITAAMAARRTAYGAAQWWQIANVLDDDLSTKVTQSLHRDPLLRLEIGLQDGTGARLALPLLTHAAALAQLGTQADSDASDEPGFDGE